MKVIKNVRLYDFKKYIPLGFVAFREQIVKVGTMNEYTDYINECKAKQIEFEEIDGQHQMMLPGLVLGHGHIYSTFARGWITPYSPKSFQDILDQLWWKLDNKLGEDEIYYSGLVSGYEYLKQGITTVIDHHASGEMVLGSLNTLKKAVVDEIGIRGIFCFETSDRFNVDACIEENLAFYEEMNQVKNTNARGLLGLHASFSLSDESLKKLGNTSVEIPLHVHVAESNEDVEWTRENCGVSIIERFNQYDLLRKDNLYAHGVHLEEHEFDLIKQTDGYMVFNPSSNMNNGVGLPPIDQAIEREIPWLIGNDGLGFSLARDYQMTVFSSNLKGPNHFQLDALCKSILNSYSYASKILDCQLGEFKEGFESDFILLPYDEITEMTDDNIFGHFIYGMIENLHPKEVYVKGIHKVHQYEVIKDFKQALLNAKECGNKLWEKVTE